MRGWGVDVVAVLGFGHVVGDDDEEGGDDEGEERERREWGYLHGETHAEQKKAGE